MIFVVAFVSAVLAVAASRSIVAESDAHRTSGTDRWWGPTCAACGSPLGPGLMRCVREGHPQRRMNGVILVVTMGISVALTLGAPTPWLIPAYVVFGWLMVLLTVTDLDTKLIPNRILFPGTAVSVGLLLIGTAADGNLDDFSRGLLAGAAYFGLMLALALIARGGLGFGDVKLAAVIGVFAGHLSWSHVAFTVLGSFILGGAVSLLLLVTRRVGRKDSIPFGPFMTTTAVLTLTVGTTILDWYGG